MAGSNSASPTIINAAPPHAKHGLWMQTPSVVYFPMCKGCGKVAIVIHGFGCKRFKTSHVKMSPEAGLHINDNLRRSS